MKLKIIKAVQFVMGREIPQGMRKWWPCPKGTQPRDNSFGYVETPIGRRHVYYGDWIITTFEGHHYVFEGESVDDLLASITPEIFMRPI